MQSVDNAVPDKPAYLHRADQGFLCPLIEPMDNVVYVDEERDCTDAHARLDLTCLHMTQSVFPTL